MNNRQNGRSVIQEVLTLDEVADFLRIPSDKLVPEIASGRLQALKIADEVRILKSDLMKYLELAKTGSATAVRQKSENLARPTDERMPDINLTPAKPFEHMWPNRRQEHYPEAYSANVEMDGALRSLRIGFTERPTAGRLRKRAVIFVDERPMVEFVGSDDFERSHKMLSLVKRKNGKRLRPGETTPPEYRNLQVEPYRKYVTGAYASSNQAIVCSKDDLSVMVQHALLRLRQIESR